MFHVEVPRGIPFPFSVLQVKRDELGNMGLAPCANSLRHAPSPNA